VPSHPGTDRRVDRAARQLAVVAISGLRRQINAACIVDADHRSSAASATGTVHDDSDHLIAGQADVHGDCGTEIVVLASGCARDGPPLR